MWKKKCFDGSEECAVSVFRVTISLAWIRSGWESHPGHLQITISQAVHFGREPLQALMTRFWSLLLGRKKRVGYVEKNLEEIWPIRVMGEVEIKLATSKWERVPKTALLGVNSGVWAVHKQVRHSRLSTCTFATTDHCLKILGASTLLQACMGIAAHIPSKIMETHSSSHPRQHPREPDSATLKKEAVSSRNVETYPYDNARIRQKIIKWFTELLYL